MHHAAKILIAEDDPASALYLETMLEANGYDVVGVVDSGTGAIERYKRARPDLVLMDVLLNGHLSGCEAALKIKQRFKEARIIFLTAHAQPEMVKYAVESEACAYLLKPYRAREILATISLALPARQPASSAPCAKVVPLKNGYRYHLAAHRLMQAETPIALSKKGTRLVEVLVQNRSSTVSHTQICLYVWGENKSVSTLRTLVHRVRAVIGYDMIRNASGMGYRIAT